MTTYTVTDNIKEQRPYEKIDDIVEIDIIAANVTNTKTPFTIIAGKLLTRNLYFYYNALMIVDKFQVPLGTLSVLFCVVISVALIVISYKKKFKSTGMIHLSCIAWLL